MQPKRQQVFDEVEAIFKGGNLVHLAKTLEYLLSGLDIPPTPLQWINPLTLARLSDQELEAPDYYKITVKYPDGKVLSESYCLESGEQPREVVLSVEEAGELLQACLAKIMREISGTKLV